MYIHNYILIIVVILLKDPIKENMIEFVSCPKYMNTGININIGLVSCTHLRT